MAAVALDGGRGDDYLAGTADPINTGRLSSLVGGPGEDTIASLECSFAQQLGARTNMEAGGGDDTMTGGDSLVNRDTMSGAGGDDELDGGLGPDVLSGGSGNDTLTAVDFTECVSCDKRGVSRFDAAPNDLLDGRTGTDTCFFDEGDTVRHCELGGVPRADHHAVRAPSAAHVRISLSGAGFAAVRAG